MVRAWEYLLFFLLLVVPHSLFADDSTKITIKPIFSPLESARMPGESHEHPGIGLAVSGGGARGLAFIGVLKVFERENIPVTLIAGVSMGGIIGGLYSCGYSAKEIEDLAHEIDWGEMLSAGPPRTTLLTTQKGLSEKSLFKLRFQGWKPVVPRALTSAQKLNQLLESLTARGGIRSNISYDYLNPRLRIICTDLLTGDRIVLSSGNLGEAMRASMAIPVAFTPVMLDGRMLVDGGLVDPIPVDVAKSEYSGPIVALNVSSNLLSASHLGDIVDIADQTTTIMSMDKKIEAMALADYSIIPDLSGIGNTDFSRIDRIISAGEEAAERAIPAIRSLISSRSTDDAGPPGYTISKRDICDLRFMPKTFFLSSFKNETTMTAGTIEENLHNAYSSGYLVEAWAELIPDSVNYKLCYHLKDNPRIADLRLDGVTLYGGEELMRLIESHPGMVLNYLQLDKDRVAVEQHYIEDGYSLVRVVTDFDDRSGELLFKVDEGRINAISIDGNETTRSWVIMRNIPFRAGDIFVQHEAEKAIEGIYSSGLFETAKLNVDPDTVGITLTVKVEEKPYNYIRAGARFDLEYKSRAFVDLVSDNVMGGGQVFFISTIIGEKKRSVALNFHIDRIFRTLFTNSLRLDYSEFKKNHYENHEYVDYVKQISYGGEITPGRQIPRLGTISFVGSLRKYKWKEPHRFDESEFTKLGLGFRSLVDTRNSLSFPERGKIHIFDLQFASDTRDKKTAYTRFFTSLESFYQITRRLNFHPVLALGASSDFMPYFDEFSLGGLNKLVGLYEDEYLGDKLLLGYIELRQKIGDRFYLLGRYGAGNAWNNIETVKLSKLMHSAGIGIALKTPIGPAQFWYGRTNKGLDAFYLDIGYDW